MLSVQKLQTIQKTGQIGQWRALIPLEGNSPVPVRLWYRESSSSYCLGTEKTQTQSQQEMHRIEAETLFYAQYVMVLTTFPRTRFPGRTDSGVVSLSVANRIGL